MRRRAFFMVVGAMALGCALVSPAAAKIDVGARSVGTASPPDVKAYGDAAFFGATNSVTFNQPIAGIAGTRSSRGYWETATDGGVFGFGDAQFQGSMGGAHLNEPVVGIAATPTGLGYWLVARDGGIFSFGDAHFFGSMGGTRLNGPVVGIAATATGNGYWLVARDGGVFSFGDARFSGSVANTMAVQAIVAIAARPEGDGYWIVSSDGRVFPFGRARFLGDVQSGDVSKPVVGIAPTRTGEGYWVAGRGTPGVLPGQVTVVRAGHSGGSGEIGLDWTAVAGASGYRVDRADATAGPFSIAVDVNLTTGKATMVAAGVTNVFSEQQTFFPASPGTHPAVVPSHDFHYVESLFVRHYFRVTAYNANGYGPSSVVVCGTPVGYPVC